MPELSTFAIVSGVVFFLIFAGVAYIAFRLLRKSVRIALRLSIVAVILLIAVAGALAIYWNSSSTEKPARPRPQPTRSR